MADRSKDHSDPGSDQGYDIQDQMSHYKGPDLDWNGDIALEIEYGDDLSTGS